MIDPIMDAVLAPFQSQVGVQGVAYGLLGLKTIRTLIDFARSLVKPGTNEPDEKQEE